MFRALKSLVPRGLYGRAALILIVPVVTIQLVVSITFIQRHFEGVTRQMTRGMVQEVLLVLDRQSTDPARAAELAQALDLRLEVPAPPPPVADVRAPWDLSGREVIAQLRELVPGILAVELADDPREVRIWALLADGAMARVTIDRRRVSASNPHQLLVLMIFTSVLMTFVAFVFLRNQLRPIKLLSEAADAFGKGRSIPYRPRGALEVRAAGRAFLDMRARIERQIEQRTLMLSGVSHDLRTPLTRLRLGLSMLPEDADQQALLSDVADMQRLVDEFLAFARGDAMEEAVPADPGTLVRRVVENAHRAGQHVTLGVVEPTGDLRLRPAAVTRAIENLVGNAIRHGTRAEVSVLAAERSVRILVDDDGPGIPPDRRDEAALPFVRLDEARDPNRGGGAGLGLSIAADIARSHGGALRLDDSPTLGGLRAELVLAR